MESFLKKIKSDLDTRILTCVKGQTIVKPFDKVYDRVREKEKVQQPVKKEVKKGVIYAEGEESLYQKIIAQFLLENPELLQDVA